MQPEIIEVLDPTVLPPGKKALPIPIIPKLDKKLHIHLLWNSKPNGDILLSNVKERLGQKYPQLVMSWFQKNASSAAADNQMINQIASKADLVIIATAD